MALPTVVANITSFLDSLSSQQRDALYDSPWTCQAVFRSLPSLAKAYVLRLLLINFPVPQDVVQAFCSDIKVHGQQHRGALQKLLTLDILIPSKQGVQPTYSLHKTFQAKLQWALSTGGRMLPNVPEEVLAAAPSVTDLDNWAHDQWEALQMYLLDDHSSGPCLPPRVPLEPLDFHRLLMSAGLLHGTKHSRKITDAGFQFLLRDSHRQLWVFLTRYINDVAAASKADLSALMSFLMQLGFMRVGQPYALEDLNPQEQAIAGHMMQLGLLLPFEAKRLGYYCPTRLASSLCATGGGADGGREAANTDIAGGHVIVESNFKVNAWTTSKVQRSLLGLFCECNFALPNFWVGSLTHESVNKALTEGISADEIVAYLQNVSDQVRLWEAETRRLRAEPAYFYDGFENLELYEATLAHARSLGWVLWSNNETKAFAAKEAGHEKIRDAIRLIKTAQAQGMPIPRLQ